MSKGIERPTVLYLIRHGATEANLARPPRLQGCRHNPPLSRLGVRQAEAPHGLTPQSLEALTECDVGRWEGLDWQTIRALDSEGYQRLHANPAEFGYPGGESFGDVHNRVKRALDELLNSHAGESILAVGHYIVNRTYLAGLLGLMPDQANQVTLDNCGISVVVRDGAGTTVNTLNAAFHLQGVAA
jgi:phosphoserine phosphatase